jgi:uncharacterized membrane protein
MELITGFEYLPDEEKMEMVAYVQDFFNRAEGDHFVEREISSTCR